MSKFNGVFTRPVGVGHIRTESTSSGRNALGAPGFRRDAKSELFLLAVSNMVGEDTHHEKANTRDSRYVRLIHEVATSDLEWVTAFAAWLRGSANMRSASLVLAAEAAAAALKAGTPGSRKIVESVLQRADEPGEMLAYWWTHHGRHVPKPVKRGIADGATRLYSERSLLKYDSDTKGVRFGDVIALMRPKPKAPWQEQLFRYAISSRLGAELNTTGLPTLANNTDLHRVDHLEARKLLSTSRTDPQEIADMLAGSGMTWEAIPSLVNGPWTAELWQVATPTMGYMALLRNLRNFDETGVSDEVAAQVAARLADRAQVARSRQFPFRFYAAHKAVGSLRWGHTLETALGHSLANIPALPGRTLVLVDQSPSMFPGPYYSGNASKNASKSDIAYAEKAALFGAAVALRAENADLCGYGFKSYPVAFSKGDAVLRTMEKFRVENGTDTFGALQRNYRGHDRVVIVTDEQTRDNRQIADPRVRRQYGMDVLRPLDALVPAHVPVYTWNLGGYAYGHATGPNWYTFGGLTDQGFEMIPLIEGGRDSKWPWEQTNAANPVSADGLSA